MWMTMHGRSALKIVSTPRTRPKDVARRAHRKAAQHADDCKIVNR